SYVDHSVRTAYLALKLAEEEGMEETMKRRFVFASYFHDIGSIGKPDSYLLSHDYDILHSVDGYLLMKYKSPLKEYARMLLFHHVAYNREYDDEMADFGVKIAIVDRFDDWERHKLPFDEVTSYIESQSGTAFDPKDVDALLKVLDHTDVRYDIRSGRYHDVLNDYIASLSFDEGQLEGYVVMLSSLFELYNGTTYNHSKTVAVTAYLLASLMGYGDDDCFKMYLAGLVHDLGKIKIPLSILDKPGKLTPEETAIMRKHIVYSREMSIDILPREIVNIATYHHERLDGTGYPNHLKAIEMTEPEEIMQVADVLSALLARRSYKEEYPYEKVKEILLNEAQAGKLSKPVIDTFIENHEIVWKEANEVIREGYDEAMKISSQREELIAAIKARRAHLESMPLSNFIDKQA
nr:HD domain-containing protein [Bacilli bacterium]